MVDLRSLFEARLAKSKAQSGLSAAKPLSPFFGKLPPEVRLRIYAHVLKAECDLKIADRTQYGDVIFNPSLLRTCMQAYLESHDLLFELNTIRTSARDFSETIGRCQAYVQTLSVWAPNGSVSLQNAIATAYRNVNPNVFKNLQTLTIEIDNITAISVRQLLCTTRGYSIPVDKDLQCPAVGLYTLPITHPTHTITLRLEHTLLHPAWQNASAATDPIPPGMWVNVSSQDRFRGYTFSRELQNMYRAVVTGDITIPPTPVNFNKTRAETHALVRTHLLPNILRRFAAQHDTVTHRILTAYTTCPYSQSSLQDQIDLIDERKVPWWQDRNRDGQVVTFVAGERANPRLTDYDSLNREVQDDEDSTGEDGDGERGDALRDRVTELLVLNCGDCKALLEKVDEWRMYVAIKERGWNPPPLAWMR
ncbi:hypothetical protein Q7P37_006318 [Cladosporium fusiforme]